MAIPAILIRKSTGEILKHANYPNEDGSSIIGLDPDLEWLAKYSPFDSPDYDSRIYELVITDSVTTDPHPDYPNLKQFKRTYQTSKRPDVDIIAAIQNQENAANEEMVSFQTKTKLNTIAINALIKQNLKLVLTTKEQDVLTEISAYAAQMWKNDAEKEAKVKQVTDGLEPNIDEGWEKLK